MKKILTALLVVLSVFALVSCSGSSTTVTSVKLNAANEYYATATLAKAPTSACGVYYKSGSTESGYILATDGVVPVFDSTGAAIGTIVANYTTDKLLSFTFVTDLEKSATGSAEITVGVLTGTTMDSYGSYKVEVTYTYIAPPKPEPIKPYTDTIDLVAEPYSRGVNANIAQESVSFVASSYDVIAFIGNGTDLSKYEAVPYQAVKNIYSTQEIVFDDYDNVEIKIEKVGTAAQAIFTYVCNYDYQPASDKVDYPAEKEFFGLDDAKIVVAGYTKDDDGNIRVDEDKVHIWSDFFVTRGLVQVIVAQDGKVTSQNIDTTSFGIADDLAVYDESGKFLFSLDEAKVDANGKKNTQYIVTKSGNGFVTFDYAETTTEPIAKTLTLSFNGVASDKGIISNLKIATIGNDYAAKEVKAQFDVAYDFAVADPANYTMTVNPYMSDYKLSVPVSKDTAKGKVSLMWWNASKVDEPGWDFFVEPDEGDEYLEVVLKNKGYDDEAIARLSYKDVPVDGKVDLTLKVATWPGTTEKAKNQVREAEEPLLVAIHDSKNTVDRLVTLKMVQNQLTITELTNTAATAGAAVALKAGLAAPATSKAFTGTAMQINAGTTVNPEWIDIDGTSVVKSAAAGSTAEAKLSFANGELKFDLNSFGGADTFDASKYVYGSYEITTGAKDANGVYVPSTVYAAKANTTPATSSVLSLSQNSITSWTGVTVGAQVLADATTEYSTTLTEAKTLIAKYMKVTKGTTAAEETKYEWVDIADGVAIDLTNAAKEYRAGAAKLSFTSGTFAATTQKASFNLTITDTVNETATGTIPEIIVGYTGTDGRFVAINYAAENEDANVQLVLAKGSSLDITFKALTGKVTASYDKAYYVADGKWVELTSSPVTFYTKDDHEAEGAGLLTFVPNVYEGTTLKTYGYFEMTGAAGATYTAGSTAKFKNVYLGSVDSTTGVFTASTYCDVIATVAAAE